jgi:hypothetical protein
MLAFLFGQSAPAQPRHTNNALFVSANDLINQSLDLLVIFKFYVDNQKNIAWLRRKINDLFSTPHQGVTHTLPSEYKYHALIEHMFHTAKHYKSVSNMNAEQILHTFFRTNNPLDSADADLALCVMLSSMENINHDEYHGTWYWASKKQVTGFVITDYSTCLPRFAIATESKISQLQSLRSQGKYIDVFNYANKQRLLVSSTEDFIRFKDQGDALRELFKQSLSSDVESVILTPSNRSIQSYD